MSALTADPNELLGIVATAIGEHRQTGSVLPEAEAEAVLYALGLNGGTTPKSKVVCPECGRDLSDVLASLIRQRGRFKAQREEARRQARRSLRLDDRSGFERQVAGALQDAIHQHGPLTSREVGSASKRIVKQVYAWLREELRVQQILE